MRCKSETHLLNLLWLSSVNQAVHIIHCHIGCQLERLPLKHPGQNLKSLAVLPPRALLQARCANTFVQGCTQQCASTIAGLAKALLTLLILKPRNFWAGGSLETIAEAKAGIMKRNKPVVLAHQPEAVAQEVLEQKANELHCPVYNAEATIKLHPKGLHTAGDQLRQMVSVERLGVPPDGPLSGEPSSQQFGTITSYPEGPEAHLFALL